MIKAKCGHLRADHETPWCPADFSLFTGRSTKLAHRHVGGDKFRSINHECKIISSYYSQMRSCGPVTSQVYLSHFISKYET